MEVFFSISAPIVTDKHRTQELDVDCEANSQKPAILEEANVWAQDKSLAKQADKRESLASEGAQLIQISI